MSHSREGSADESQRDHSDESNEIHKKPRRSINRHWTSEKNVFQGMRKDEVSESKETKTLLPIPKLPLKKKNSSPTRKDEVKNGMSEIKEEREEEHPEIIRSARVSRHHATVNLDVKNKEMQKQEDPKFKDYIRNLQQEHRKDRLASFGDKLQDHLKRSVKEHLEKVRDQLQNLNRSKALYELIVEDPEHQQEAQLSPKKQQSLSISRAGVFDYYEDEISKGTQTTTTESQEQGNQTARVRVMLNSGLKDQLVVTEKGSGQLTRERLPNSARIQIIDKRTENEPNKENYQKDSNRIVIPARKLEMKDYTNTDRENFMEDLALSELTTYRTQGFATDRTFNQTESLDLSRFKRPISTPMSKYEEFRDTEINKSSQFPEIDDSDRIDKEELLKIEENCLELINRGKYQEALHIISELIDSLCLPPNDPHSVYLNYLVSEIYTKQKKGDQALQFALDAIHEIPSPDKDKDVFQYRYALMNLVAKLQGQKKQNAAALNTYQEMERFLQTPSQVPVVEKERLKLFESEKYNLLYNKSNQLMELNENEKARDLYKEVARAYEKQKDPESARKYVNCLRKQAKCCSKLKKFKEAHEILSSARAFALKNQKLQGEIELLSSLYDDLATACNQVGDLEKFSKYANTALKLKYEHYGPDHLQTAMGLISAGKAYLANKEYEKAYGKLEAGNEILERLKGRNTLMSANCYILMAQIMYQLKKYQFAIDLYELALDIFITILGKDHIDTNKIYLNLLYLAFLIKKYDKVSYFEQKLLGSLEGVCTDMATIIFNEVGNIFRNNHKNKRALDFYQRSIHIIDELVNEKKSNRGSEIAALLQRQASVYCNIASLYNSGNDAGKSVENYQRALEILEKNQIDDTLQKILINTNMAKVCLQQQQWKEASSYVKVAKNIIQTSGKNKQAIDELEQISKAILEASSS